VELSAERLGNGPSDAGFAHTGRSNKTQDWTSKTVLDLAYSQVLHNSLLQLVQAIMVDIKVLPTVNT